jgi:hypothetical protein
MCSRRTEMETILTDVELAALADMVLERAHIALRDDCDCPLHSLSKEERVKLIDRAIDKTNEEFQINGDYNGSN